MKTPNLVRLFTPFGPMWIDTNQLNSDKATLTIYDSKGNKVSDFAKSKAAYQKAACGIHRDYVYASIELTDPSVFVYPCHKSRAA